MCSADVLKSTAIIYYIYNGISVSLLPVIYSFLFPLFLVSVPPFPLLFSSLSFLSFSLLLFFSLHRCAPLSSKVQDHVIRPPPRSIPFSWELGEDNESWQKLSMDYQWRSSSSNQNKAWHPCFPSSAGLVLFLVQVFSTNMAATPWCDDLHTTRVVRHRCCWRSFAATTKRQQGCSTKVGKKRL